MGIDELADKLRHDHDRRARNLIDALPADTNLADVPDALRSIARELVWASVFEMMQKMRAMRRDPEFRSSAAMQREHRVLFTKQAALVSLVAEKT